jgi:hypothetical protein
MNTLPVASTAKSMPSGDQVNSQGRTAIPTLNSSLFIKHFLQHGCNSHRRSFEESAVVRLTTGGIV